MKDESATDQEQPSHAERDDARIVQMQLEHFEAKQHAARARQAKLEALMSRKGAKNWKPEKIAKMIRRLSEARSVNESSTSAVENLSDKIAARK